jgi:hypothetical protein
MALSDKTVWRVKLALSSASRTTISRRPCPTARIQPSGYDNVLTLRFSKCAKPSGYDKGETRERVNAARCDVALPPTLAKAGKIIGFVNTGIAPTGVGV